MKLRVVGAAFAAGWTLASSLQGSVTILDTAYSYSTYHTHSVGTSAIASFDWDSGGSTWYQTSTSAYQFGGLYKWDGSTQTTAVPGSSDFAGASVVRIGDHIYYNSSDFSDQKIFKYGPLSGVPSASNISTAFNWGLYRRGSGEIFITGAVGFGTNQVFYTTLDSSGNFTAPPISLGITIGSSGPVAFDASGNMYYAPGYSDTKIYKYTAADVAAAIANPTLNPLPSAASRLWRDYSGDFPSISGGTGMAFDEDGNLLLTLTDFSNPSFLARFDVDASGNYDGFSSILSSTDRLGDVRFKDGSIYLANGYAILQVIPEPTASALLAVGGVAMAAAAWRSRHRNNPMTSPRSLTLLGMILAAAAFRLLPHPPNFTPIGGMALFAGAVFADKRAAFALPLAAMALSDLALGFNAITPFVYSGVALTTLIGFWLRKRRTPGSVAAGALASSILFFVVTNFAVWAVHDFYPRDVAGLGLCFLAAIPFFQNSLAGDLVFSLGLFGCLWLAERRFVWMRAERPPLRPECVNP